MRTRWVLASATSGMLDISSSGTGPSGRRGDGPVLLDGLRSDAVGLAQHTTVVLDSRQESTASCSSPHDGLGGGQTLGVLLEPLDAEQFRADRFCER
jgi:hypothetical protein